ncbi:MAG TPA: ankyrin repeat domain-containing protein [Pirellulales bacterium]|nr:ankyrin repeat domain-containing protein [Pirellulales bacterium]
MVGELSVANLEQIDVFSRWQGFADPHSLAKLTITRQGDRFVRQEEIAGNCDALPAECVAQLFEQLCQPAIESLDPRLFDAPEPVIRSHFASIWTNDHPQVLVRLKFSEGRTIDVLTTGQHVCLLPIQVRDSGGLLNYQTFQPALSRSMAALMPVGYLDRDRLEGACSVFQADIDDYHKGTGSWQIDSESGGAPESEESDDRDRLSFEEQQKRVNEMLRRLSMRNLESPEEKELAERSGKISERLLKNLPLEEVADILSRGGNPNVADENGQTALMKAAFPPLDRERFRLLARAGANLEARRTRGCATGLHLACDGEMADSVEEWIRAGADIHARLPEGSTPLMLGASSPAIVRLLLAGGARPNDVDQDGHTALVYAIDRQLWFQAIDDIEAIRLLIDAGTDLTLRDRNGLTPLGFARQHHQMKLLEHEASLAIQEAWGRKPTAEEERARADLMRKMMRESYPNSDPDKWNDLTLAEAIINLFAAAGGTD